MCAFLHCRVDPSLVAAELANYDAADPVTST